MDLREGREVPSPVDEGAGVGDEGAQGSERLPQLGAGRQRVGLRLDPDCCAEEPSVIPAGPVGLGDRAVGGHL